MSESKMQPEQVHVAIERLTAALERRDLEVERLRHHLFSAETTLRGGERCYQRYTALVATVRRKTVKTRALVEALRDIADKFPDARETLNRALNAWAQKP